MTYHLHLGFLQFFVIFVGVALIGTGWRLLAAWLLTLPYEVLKQFGAAMGFVW